MRDGGESTNTARGTGWLALVVLAVGCGSNEEPSVPPPDQPANSVSYFIPIAETDEIIALTCDEPVDFDFIRAVGTIWTKDSTYGVSIDDGRTWTEFPTDALRFTGDAPAIVGDVLVASAEPIAGNYDGLVVSVDAGLTWTEPVFDGGPNDLPIGTAVASLTDTLQLAHTPSSRLYVSSGDGWSSPPGAFAPLFGFARHGSFEDYETAVWDQPPRLAVSADRGANWEVRQDLPINLERAFPFADGNLTGIWRVSEPDRGVAFSEDFGLTWKVFSHLSPLVTVGPEANEAWAPQVIGIDSSGEQYQLVHTTDGGENWTNVRFELDGEAVPALRFSDAALHTRRAFRDQEGRTVFGLEWDGETRICREVL